MITKKKQSKKKIKILNTIYQSISSLSYDEVIIVEPEFEISREEYESYKL